MTWINLLVIRRFESYIRVCKLSGGLMAKKGFEKTEAKIDLYAIRRLEG